MEHISLFLAKFWGWYLIIFFFILSFNPKRIVQIIKDLEDQKFTILISFLSIIIGLLNILFHNLWKGDYRLIITIIGWFALLNGLALFIFPKNTISWINYMNIKFVQILYILLFFIGVFLLSMGYGIIFF
ncbi:MULTISPECIES: hypothetical protein [Flavobacteriaceae]|uniref:Uncharacterized protein n=2 Tax=Flavobacteriaceae TaxID=49546 RepID=A0A4Y8AWD8_9FLAO|nr:MULTISPECIES: hypothetical protein [Flavobacteriaceae]TEW76344.1 hypothetical protein E2488_00400 [Gramella jeungdoensis]GGK52142.1 hypothetical protein GCM10007963_20570 [Lutibacter litoralis]